MHSRRRIRVAVDEHSIIATRTACAAAEPRAISLASLAGMTACWRTGLETNGGAPVGNANADLGSAAWRR